MRSNTIFYALLCLFLPFFSHSQDLKIVYNAENGELQYFQGKVAISKPIVKKGGLILLEIKNYNNYLYDVDFQESHEDFQIAQGSGLLGGIEGLSIEKFLNAAVPTDIISEPSYVMESYGSASAKPAEESSLSKQELRILQLERQIKTHLSDLDLIESRVSENATAVVKLKDQRELKAISLEEVQKVKYHPKIPPSRIKAYSKSYFEKVLDVSDINQVSLTYLLEKKSDKEELRDLLKNTEQRKIAYNEDLVSIKDLSPELRSLKADSDVLYKVLKASLKAPIVLEKIEVLDADIQALLAEATNDNIQDMINIYYEYEEISANTFSTAFRAQGAGDIVNLDVKLLLKDSMRFSGASPLVQLSTIKVPVYGGIKLNASVGLNFGSFFQQPRDYFLKDSILQGQSTDQFLPYITSFLHFYAQGRKNVSLGGSLGIGIPISSSANFQSPNFFLGPSLFFGNGERFVLNFGLMGGKVPQLSHGFAVGDTFDASADFIPLESLYQLGFFTGLSFNIGK